MGVAPACFSAFSTVTFARIGARTSLPPNRLHSHKVKRQEKTRVQQAILTSFTFFTQFSRSAILLGWSDPEGVWPRERPKNGRRSSPTRCFARGQSECLAVCNVLLFGHFRKDRGDAKGDVHGDLGFLRSRHRATPGKH